MSMHSAAAKRRRDRRSITGLRPVNEYLYEGWRIEIDERLLGTTVKRRQFSATIRRRQVYQREFLSGFSSKQAAQRAAEARVDELSDRQRPLWRPAGSRLTQRK